MRIAASYAGGLGIVMQAFASETEALEWLERTPSLAGR
jgi:hypothetical protein